MALQFFTGFDYFNETQVQRVWSYYNNGVSVAPGRFLGRAWQWNNQSGYLSTTIPNASTVIIGMAFLLTGADPTNPFLVFQDATANINEPITQIDLRVTSDAGFQITRNGTLIATSSPGIFTFGFWNYIEVKVHINESSGTIQIKVNGQTYFTQTSINTQYTGNSYVNMFRVQSFASTGYTITIDDLYICDDTTFINNDFRGECRIQTQYPTANGDTNNFEAVGAVSNWQCVDATISNDGTTYVRDGQIGDIDDYVMGTISLTGAIYGVQVNVTNRKDDVGSRNMTPIIKSGGTFFTGNTFQCGSDYNIARTIWQQEPKNIANWTNSSVNALTVGLKIVG
jgi:hypothetical protein